MLIPHKPNSASVLLRLLYLAIAIQISIVFVASGQSYDFEALKAGQPLLGQDGWIGWAGQTSLPMVATARLSYALKRETFAAGGGGGGTGSGMAARVNDARFKFEAHSPTNTCAAIQFDVRPSGGDAMFGLGSGLPRLPRTASGHKWDFSGGSWCAAPRSASSTGPTSNPRTTKAIGIGFGCRWISPRTAAMAAAPCMS